MANSLMMDIKDSINLRYVENFGDLPTIIIPILLLYSSMNNCR